MSSFTVIHPKELNAEASEGAVVLDVRTRMEHAECRLKVAHELVPLDELNPSSFLKSKSLSKDTRIVIICRSGNRSRRAAEAFLKAGCTNVFVVGSGLLGCIDCGHQIEGSQANMTPSQRSISLERQMRIVVGVISVVGILLGLYVHPAFLGVSIFVSVGLVYSGITEWCAIIRLLKNAPWNRVKDDK